jgi:Mg2+-importing ATPase
VTLPDQLQLNAAATLPVEAVFSKLGTSSAGLSSGEAARRLSEFGRNEITDRQTSAFSVLLRQLNNPFLILLVCTAILSIFLHDSSDAYIILCIVVLSVGLSFISEYRSERAVADLRARVRPKALVLRDGQHTEINGAELVPGDVAYLNVGDIVPADMRLLEVRGLECDESALTGEALPQAKTAAVSTGQEQSVTRSCCAYSGTIVKDGVGAGVVVATGAAAQYGSIAQQLMSEGPQTAFELGLRNFSLLLVRVTVVLTSCTFAINVLLHHSLVESLLFALSIAIGLTPQLLPAIVTVSLSYGARVLAKRGVIVKRLVSIEDLGNVQVLFTDKTGTLTEGRVRFRGAFDRMGAPSDEGIVLGIVCSDVVVENGHVLHGNAIDMALRDAAGDTPIATASGYRVIDREPFSYDRQMMSVLADAPNGERLLISKGAPEGVLLRCAGVDDNVRQLIDRETGNGNRVIALASRSAPGLTHIGADDEQGLQITALLSFADQPKADARASIDRLRQLNVALKILTGDNPQVAQSICRQIDIPVRGVLTGPQIAAMSDEQLRSALDGTDIFARVTPDQKSRIIRLQRAAGVDVGYLGDGINDAVALHDADVGISVDSAVDVAKDAATIVLLEKDLDVLADGVMEGRRIFANTTKYVLMGTSSNFGNMFSAAGASLFLRFLPMLPSQILLNNLLYDVSEMSIPTDNVDEEQLQRPAHWDQAFIRRLWSFSVRSPRFSTLPRSP